MSALGEPGFRSNPYVGLRPFFLEDSLYFFGRGQQVAELLEILHQHRFLGVVGSSGSGKSSLVRAGLLPKLLGGFLARDRDRWHTVQIKPGDAPVSNFAAGLLKATGEARTPEARESLEQAIRDGHTDGVVDFLVPRLQSNANVFVLVDQFEEIFTFRGSERDDAPKSVDPGRRKERARRKAEAADFVDLLLRLAEGRDLPIYVALTMRTDFLGDCDLFYGLPEALNRGRYLVPRLTRPQLREAIEGPAMLMRARVAPRLLDHLLNELGDRFDRLPVLQHALMRTWDAWQHGGAVGSIDLQHYTAAGGLALALDQDAEGALLGLDLAATTRVFKRLTDTDVSQRLVRSPARVSELVAAAGVERSVVEEIVRRFQEDGRSFVHSSDDGRPDDQRVDISHESLIRQWDRLRKWVDDERQSRDQYVELVARARRWARGVAAPLRDPELQTVLDWKAATTPSPGWAVRYAEVDDDLGTAMAYLDASVAGRCHELATLEVERRWKSWRPWVLLAVIVTLGSIALNLHEVISPGRELNWWRLYATVGLFIAMGVAMVEGCWRVHRRLAFAVILRRFVALSEHGPIEAEARTAELRDAVVVHDTTYASAYRRIAGFAIDGLVFVVVAMVAIFVIIAILEPDTLADPSAEVSDEATIVWVAVAAIFGWLYSTLQITSRRQATLGMRALSIFRTDLHGRRLSFTRASGWFLVRLLSYYGLGLGFLFQLFSRRGQTFHDWMTGVVVLRRPPSEPR